jgi:hypothetical protein
LTKEIYRYQDDINHTQHLQQCGNNSSRHHGYTPKGQELRKPEKGRKGYLQVLAAGTNNQ